MVTILNLVAWGWLFQINPKAGFKILFGLMFVLNAWILLARILGIITHL